jgi:hypothetical protein
MYTRDVPVPGDGDQLLGEPRRQRLRAALAAQPHGVRDAAPKRVRGVAVDACPAEHVRADRPPAGVVGVPARVGHGLVEGGAVGGVQREPHARAEREVRVADEPAAQSHGVVGAARDRLARGRGRESGGAEERAAEERAEELAVHAGQARPGVAAAGREGSVPARLGEEEGRDAVAVGDGDGGRV